MASANTKIASFDDLINAAEEAGVQLIDPQSRGYRYQNGVLVHQSCYWGDVYHGTSDTLISLGLIESHMLPGQPGRNRSSVSIPGADGEMRSKGALKITRRSRNVFEVYVWTSNDDEGQSPPIHSPASLTSISGNLQPVDTSTTPEQPEFKLTLQEMRLIRAYRKCDDETQTSLADCGEECAKNPMLMRANQKPQHLRLVASNGRA